MAAASFYVGRFVLLRSAALIKRAKQLDAVKARQINTQDLRRPILYLRTFSEDELTGQSMVSAREPFAVATEEEQLATILNEVGPFKAIGRPDEALPHLGAHRLYPGDDEWRPTIIDLISQAQLVVLRVGETQGFLWELERVVELVRPERMVFLVPYDEYQYIYFREKAEQLLPGRLPKYVATSNQKQFCSLRGIIYFDPNWKPHFVEIKRAAWFTRQLQSPILSSLKVAVQPVFNQLRLPWKPPGIAWTRIAVVLLLLTSGSWVLNQGLRDSMFLDLFVFAPWRVRQSYAKFQKRLDSTPEYQVAVAGLTEQEVEALVMKSFRKGLLRLSDDRLLLYTTLISKALASERDNEVCGSLARSAASRQKVQEALEGLEPIDIENWYELELEAVIAELRKTPEPRVVDSRQYYKSRDELLGSLPEDHSTRLRHYLQDPTPEYDNDGEVCWCERVLAWRINQLGEPHGSILARAIVQFDAERPKKR